MKNKFFIPITVYVLLSSVLHLSQGCKKDDSGDAKIENGKEPVASFIANKTLVKVNDQVMFSDQSLNNPSNWLWDFGDGMTSDVQNPTHTYEAIGDYTIKLIATNQHGSDNEIKENYVVATESEIGSLVDTRDGKVYKTVTINNQVWMAENLNYDTAGVSWAYNDEDTNAAIYGRLYTWEAAQLVCPDGWSLPNDTTLVLLINFLGGSDIAGGALKETGLEHWDSPNTGATNSSGFSALAGGIKLIGSGNYHGLGSSINFWGSEIHTSGTVATYGLGTGGPGISKYGVGSAYYAHYIRCVKKN